MNVSKIYRLDAMHDLDGAFTRFFQFKRDADRSAELLRFADWSCDVYGEDVESEAAKLLTRSESIYPLADTEQLTDLLADLNVTARALAARGAS